VTNKSSVVIAIRAVALIALIATTICLDDSAVNFELPSGSPTSWAIKMFPLISVFLAAWLGGRVGYITAPLVCVAYGVKAMLGDPYQTDHTEDVGGAFIGAFIIGLPVGVVTSLIHYNRYSRARTHTLITDEASAREENNII
jgi:hypothetical protein